MSKPSKGSGLKEKAPYTISPSKHLKFQAMWTEVDVCMLINYVEESQSKAGNSSTIASGLGPAYLAEKGANIVTEAGQLVMDDLVETQPDIGQFQSKGFKYLEHMQQFVPPSKAKGANLHYSSNTHPLSQLSQPLMSTSSKTSSFTQSVPVFMQPVSSFKQPVPPFALSSIHPLSPVKSGDHLV
ncbi:hypothetical protein J3A83DRAFT_4184667 [Scleroderma citrinum]